MHPFKMIGNMKISTLWFNMMFIWLMNLLPLRDALFQCLKKLLNLLERINIPGFGSDRLVPPWELIK